MKERLDEIGKLTDKIQGGMDSSDADNIRLEIKRLAGEVRDLLDNRSRVK